MVADHASNFNSTTIHWYTKSILEKSDRFWDYSFVRQKKKHRNKTIKHTKTILVFSVCKSFNVSGCYEEEKHTHLTRTNEFTGREYLFEKEFLFLFFFSLRALTLVPFHVKSFTLFYSKLMVIFDAIAFVRPKWQLRRVTVAPPSHNVHMWLWNSKPKKKRK